MLIFDGIMTVNQILMVFLLLFMLILGFVSN